MSGSLCHYSHLNLITFCSGAKYKTKKNSAEAELRAQSTDIHQTSEVFLHYTIFLVVLKK